MKMVYIEPYMKVVEMAIDENVLADSNTFDFGETKEFKDDDLWNEEVTSEGAQKSNLWDKEW